MAMTSRLSGVLMRQQQQLITPLQVGVIAVTHCVRGEIKNSNANSEKLVHLIPFYNLVITIN
ncbi:hypothetical protein [Xenorhabdus sp. TH1]|uniref:hypothetical protein n=1 Tax=Xenorhabdus sp. TH1 TaxID=3130166 RepID=UPI0030CB9D43